MTRKRFTTASRVPNSREGRYKAYVGYSSPKAALQRRLCARNRTRRFHFVQRAQRFRFTQRRAEDFSRCRQSLIRQGFVGNQAALG